MEFKMKTNSNEVSISKNTIRDIISLLSNVDCTCVWSEMDNQYIKVNDIPQDIIKELDTKLKFAN